MRNSNYFILLIIALLFVSCKSPNTFLEITFDSKKKDFSFLKEALKGKKIVALGEASHGYGNLQATKAEMVKYLHKEMGFEVVILEAGYGDVGMAWSRFEEGQSGKSLCGASVYQNFKSDEILPLYDYLVEQWDSDKKLEYAGFDTQISGNTFEFGLELLIKKFEPKVIQDSIQTGLDGYYKMFQFRDSLEAWSRYKSKLIKGVDLARSVIETYKEEILSAEVSNQEELTLLDNTLSGLKSTVDYNFGETFTRGLALRDSVMAQNVITLVEERYKGKKVVLWGHNGHIEKANGLNDNIKWMGHYLKEKYGDSYYALGMYVKKGTFHSHMTNKSQSFDIADPYSIESIIDKAYNSDAFLNFPSSVASSKDWYHNVVKGFEPEAGGMVEFVPSVRFDGVMQLRQTNAPTTWKKVREQ